MRYINESPLPFHAAATRPPCRLFTPSRRLPGHPPASSNHFSIAGPSPFILAHSSTSHHELHSCSPSPSGSFLFGLSIPAHQNTLCSPPVSLSPHPFGGNVRRLVARDPHVRLNSTQGYLLTHGRAPNPPHHPSCRESVPRRFVHRFHDRLVVYEY